MPESSHSERPRSKYARSRKPTKNIDVIQIAAFRLAQVGLLVAVTALPWLVGGVTARVQSWFFLALSGTLGCFLIAELRDASRTRPLSLGVVPLMLGGCLGLVQVIPMPTSVLRYVAPVNAELWSSFSLPPPADDGGISGSLSELSEIASNRGRLTISLYPNSTLRDVSLIVAAAVVFFLASQLFSSGNSPVVVLAVIAINGALYSFFGIAQLLSWNGKIYGFIELPQGGSPFAAFVNRNHAASYLNLCLGAVLGLVIWTFSARRESELFDQAPSETLVGWLKSLMTRSLEFLAKFDGLRALAAVAGIAILAGLVVALSRGGWMSLLAAVTAIAVLYRAKLRLDRYWVVLAASVAVVAVLIAWLGYSEIVKGRAATLMDSNVVGGRLDHWINVIPGALDFWRVGSGLGTYRYVYRLYDRTPSRTWFQHAENHYLESVIEAGFPALVLVVLFIVACIAVIWRLMEQPVRSKGFACGAVALYALFNQMVHALVDFSLYIPANLALFALISGVAAGRAGRLAPRVVTRQQAQAERRWTRVLDWIAYPRVLGYGMSVAVATVLLVFMGLFGVQAHLNAAVDIAQKGERLGDDPDFVVPAELEGRILRLSSALLSAPRDSEAQLDLGGLLIYQMRQRIVARELQLNPSLDKKVIWASTSLPELHRLATQLEMAGQTVELEKLRNDASLQLSLKQIEGALKASRSACPLIAETHLLIAEIGRVATEKFDEGVHLARVRRLCSSNPFLLLEVGQIELQSGNPDMAVTDWRSYLEVDSSKLSVVLKYALSVPSLHSRLERLLPAKPEALVTVARNDFQGDNFASVRERLIDQATSLMDEGSLPSAERSYLAGTIAELRGDPGEAILCLRRAVEQRPHEAAWHFHLAQLLEKEGFIDEAHEQARECVRRDPSNSRYESLLKELIRMRLRKSST